MKTQNLRKKLHEHWAHRRTLLFALAVMVCSCIAATGWADALFILTGADDTAIVLDGKGNAPDLSSQMVHVSSGAKGYDVMLASGQPVTVRYGGQVITATSKKESVSALLKRLDIAPGPLETIAVDLSGPGVELTVAEDITYYDKVTEDVAFETVRVANPEMEKGTEKVVQAGRDGVRTSIYEVVWSNGEEISRQFVEELDSTAVDEIVEYGTAVDVAADSAVAPERSAIASVTKNADGSGTLTLQSGTTLNFSGAKSMTATAYTAGYGGADYTTATGTFVRVGTVAVDKSVIPLGSKLYIVTNDGVVYGMAVAEDTGVRGNKVDLYYETYQQCINFGRRSCTVYILE
ncbi:MAG: G5 domain-containing protein [Oscillospiraceae bacterium]|nr:G5 domain-containing protein [Oscillospiraceae bacterium]